MTTADNPETPTVPTITTAPAAITIHRTNREPFAFAVAPGGQLAVATELRGALADAYRAGIAEGERRAARNV